MMEKGLQNLTYLKDIDGSFVVVGADAIGLYLGFLEYADGSALPTLENPLTFFVYF